MDASEQLWRGSGTVLLVDDDDMIRSITGRMLGYMGFDILEADNGNAALRVFQDNAERIDLVILDVTMPGLNGIEVLRAIRDTHPHARVALSAGDMPDARRDEAEALRVTGYIHKPYELLSLNTAVRKLLEPAT